MRFRILGPLEVDAEGRTVALGGAKPRAVLAVLLLHANEPVSAERIALALWGEDAPAGAVKTVQVHISRLRKALADADVLTTEGTAYRLRVRPGELDAHRFDQLVAEGREALAAGDAEGAAAALRDALSLWRGPPLHELADNGQRGLLRNMPPVEDPTPLDAGTAKRGIPFNVTISADEEGRNVVRSESYIVNVTRPDQPIEYWGECSTLTVRCEGTAGTKPEADIVCTVRATRRLPGQVTVTIVRARVPYARDVGEMDGKTLVVRPVAMRTLTPGRYQAVVLLERGKAARRFWTTFELR